MRASVSVHSVLSVRMIAICTMGLEHAEENAISHMDGCDERERERMREREVRKLV